jgi:hypothetical protein
MGPIKRADASGFGTRVGRRVDNPPQVNNLPHISSEGTAKMGQRLTQKIVAGSEDLKQL